MRIIETWSDCEMCDAAGSLLAKIEAVLPEELRPMIRTCHLLAPANHDTVAMDIDPVELRRAIREQRYVNIDYSDINGTRSMRRIRPLGLAFYGPVWLLFTWCELRLDFRSFRLDRICAMEVTGDRFQGTRPRPSGFHEKLGKLGRTSARRPGDHPGEPAGCNRETPP
ncbi:MAG: WYL domain-containing protein [Geminicoccaceae bacterium]